jgi:hypothetical protein
MISKYLKLCLYFLNFHSNIILRISVYFDKYITILVYYLILNKLDIY